MDKDRLGRASAAGDGAAERSSPPRQDQQKARQYGRMVCRAWLLRSGGRGLFRPYGERPWPHRRHRSPGVQAIACLRRSPPSWRDTRNQPARAVRRAAVATSGEHAGPHGSIPLRKRPDRTADDDPRPCGCPARQGPRCRQPGPADTSGCDQVAETVGGSGRWPSPVR